MHALLLAFGWFPEIKGITVVLIAVTVMIGGAYLIVSTNVGGRLGLLITLSALFGWMMCMAAIWAVYGIGLKGTAAAWKPMEIITGDLGLARNEVARHPELLQASTSNASAGWLKLKDDDPRRGQTIAEGDVIIQGSGIFKAGDYEAVSVYDKGGERYPNVSFHLGRFKFNMDYVAFFHKPHYAVVEQQALVKQATEPGKAPPTPVVDEKAPPRYVLMYRDRGSLRQPAFMIMFGSAIIFGLLVYMLHARDRVVAANRAGALVPATGGD